MRFNRYRANTLVGSRIFFPELPTSGSRYLVQHDEQDLSRTPDLGHCFHSVPASASPVVYTPQDVRCELALPHKFDQLVERCSGQTNVYYRLLAEQFSVSS
jgi:hypothetical protein